MQSNDKKKRKDEKGVTEKRISQRTRPNSPVYNKTLPKHFFIQTSNNHHPSSKRADSKPKITAITSSYNPFQLITSPLTKNKIPSKQIKKIIFDHPNKIMTTKLEIEDDNHEQQKKNKQQIPIATTIQQNNYIYSDSEYHDNMIIHNKLNKKKIVQEKTSTKKFLEKLNFYSLSYMNAEPAVKLEKIKNSLKLKKQNRYFGVQSQKSPKSINNNILLTVTGNTKTQTVFIPKKQYLFRFFDQDALYHEIRQTLQPMIKKEEYVQFPKWIAEDDEIQKRCQELIPSFFTQKYFQEKNTKIQILPIPLIKIICQILAITPPMYIIRLDPIQVVILKRRPPSH